MQPHLSLPVIATAAARETWDSAGIGKWYLTWDFPVVLLLGEPVTAAVLPQCSQSGAVLGAVPQAPGGSPPMQDPALRTPDAFHTLCSPGMWQGPVGSRRAAQGEMSCGQGAETSPHRSSSALRDSQAAAGGFFPPSAEIFPEPSRAPLLCGAAAQDAAGVEPYWRQVKQVLTVNLGGCPAPAGTCPMGAAR